MIIATIGHQKYVLNELAEAEALLKILSNASVVDNTYVDLEGERLKEVFYTDDRPARLNIEITPDREIMPYDQAMELISDRQKKKSEAA